MVEICKEGVEIIVKPRIVTPNWRDGKVDICGEELLGSERFCGNDQGLKSMLERMFTIFFFLLIEQIVSKKLKKYRKNVNKYLTGKPKQYIIGTEFIFCAEAV